MLLDAEHGYLSTGTNSKGQRMWTVIYHEQPLMADTQELSRALAVAFEAFGRVTLRVWDGNRGCFVSEMVADPWY